MKHLIFLPILLFILGIGTNSVFACSTGGEPYNIEFISNRDIVVNATIVDVEERGYNAILEVHRYLKGQGERYIVINRYPVGLHTGYTVRGYDVGCTYDGGGRIWQTGQTAYFGLKSQNDGSFTDGGFLDSPFYPIENGIVTFRNYDSDNNQLPVAEFDALLAEITGQAEPFIPDASGSYPLMRSLTITTEARQRYILNPNHSLRSLDLANDAFAISPDGAHVAFRLDENTFDFRYVWPVRDSRGGDERLIEGQNLSFSPNSDFVAVWDENNLSIYLFNNLWWSDYGQEMNLDLVAQVPFSNSVASSERKVIWSGNGSTIAFEDSAGIWLWNIFTMEAASLILSNSPEIELLQLLELSTTGRYLRYGDNSNWILMDTTTGELRANQLVTEDENSFIAVNYNNEHSYFNPEHICRAPIQISCPRGINQAGSLLGYYFVDNSLTLITCSSSDETCRYGDYSYQLWDFNDNEERNLHYVELFAHDGLYQKDAFAIDYQLYVPIHNSDEFEQYDFSSQLDSPIAYIEWGQPIFYEEH